MEQTKAGIVAHRKILLTSLLGLFILTVAIPLSAQTPKPSNFLPLSPGEYLTLGLNLSGTDAEQLRSKGEVLRFHDGKPNIALLPDTRILSDINAGLVATKADLAIETLLIYPIPSRYHVASSQNPEASWGLDIYNILHRFKSMEGIKYYSASRKEMRTFFIKSTLVESMAKRNPVADPIYGATEPFHTLYAQQEDSTFGNNLYKVEVRALDSNTMALRMQNAEQIWYGLVPVLGASGLDMHILIMKRGNYIVFYGTSGFSVPKMLGIDEKARNSFYNRLIALYSWFTGELEK